MPHDSESPCFIEEEEEEEEEEVSLIITRIE